MSRKPQNREKTICFCYNVSEQTIVEAIRGGCRSLLDVRLKTYASTGCAGCSEEVKKLLRKHAVETPSSSDPGKVSNG